MNSKAVAIGLVAIIAVAGVAGALVMSNSDDSSDNDKKGWWAWDPTVTTIKTADFVVGPRLMPAIDNLYKDVYGSDVNLSKYTMEDMPEDFLAFDSLVVSDDNDKVVIKSTIRDKSTADNSVVTEFVVDKCPTHLITSSGFAGCLYTLLEMKYGAEKATDMLWDYIYGLDPYSWTTSSMKDLYGLEIPENIVKVSSTYDYVGNLETYTEYVEDCTANGETLLIMSTGSLKCSAAEMKPFYDMLGQADGRADTAFFFSAGLNDVIAAFEVIGAIYGLEDVAQQYIDDFRLNMYAVNQESKLADKGYGVYYEVNSGKAAGTGTITNAAFEILNLDNINHEPQWKVISDEIIIEKMPHVIIFNDNNKKPIDELMRVPSE